MIFSQLKFQHHNHHNNSLIILTKIYEHYKFYDIFDHQCIYLIFDDVSEIFGVKKICFKNKIGFFFCLKKQHDIAIETFDEMFVNLSSRILKDFRFDLRAKSIADSDYLYVLFFFLAKK